MVGTARIGPDSFYNYYVGTATCLYRRASDFQGRTGTGLHECHKQQPQSSFLFRSKSTHFLKKAKKTKKVVSHKNLLCFTVNKELLAVKEKQQIVNERQLNISL